MTHLINVSNRSYLQYNCDCAAVCNISVQADRCPATSCKTWRLKSTHDQRFTFIPDLKLRTKNIPALLCVVAMRRTLRSCLLVRYLSEYTFFPSFSLIFSFCLSLLYQLANKFKERNTEVDFKMRRLSVKSVIACTRSWRGVSVTIHGIGYIPTI
jgi:hypothetical protein